MWKLDRRSVRARARASASLGLIQRMLPLARNRGVLSRKRDASRLV